MLSQPKAESKHLRRPLADAADSNDKRPMPLASAGVTAPSPYNEKALVFHPFIYGNDERPRKADVAMKETWKLADGCRVETLL